MAEQSNEPKYAPSSTGQSTSGLVSKLGGILKDGVYVVAATGAIALTTIPRHLITITEKMGIEPTYASSLDTALMTFGAAAGAVSGITKRLGVSLAVYTATLIPEIYDLCTGEPNEALRGFLAKTVIYGVGYTVSSVVKFVAKANMKYTT